MTTIPPTSEASDHGPRAPLAGNIAVILVGALLTIAIELGLYYGSVSGGAGKVGAMRGAMLAAIGWVILSSPAFAAGGRGWFWTIFRGITPANASAVLLAWLWRDTAYLSLPAAAKIYCMLLTIALAGACVANLARQQAGRFTLAVAISVVMFAAAATPFWVGGLLESAYARQAVQWTVWVNPVYSISSAMSDINTFTWQQATVLYGITRVGDYAAPPPVEWHTAPLLYGACAVAAALATIAMALFRRKSVS